MNFRDWQKNQKVILIDGSMSLGLEEQGLDLNDELWTAKALVNEPQKIEKVHQNYYDAGANISITSSYQATVAGFERLGHTTEESRALIKKTVQLAKQAQAKSQGTQEKWVAASIGPYGAYLADGSEYRGNYGLSQTELVDFHRERFGLLLEAEPDLLAFETIPDLTEIQALIELLTQHPKATAWLTVTLKDAYHLCDGTDLRVFQQLAESSGQIIAYGVNCVQPDLVLPALEYLKENATKSLVAYPNSGAIYDPATKAWTHSHAVDEVFSNEALKWHGLGCKWIGGCCCTSSKEISLLKETFAAIL
ncbi:homocysteine s-methyltransferase [Trichococcus palustris]|jgi:homocysteine S-methyltransferase|uniref:S-methylmethionine:homocysteine methyltransferase n=1 Tax=Trichococcus palustris TaxID=140314 RepID=A0A143YQN6_9LACT|nr:homocysteine S-methyltransferase [Trichococcus palustris]CZQ95671.1 homocysteine s-methyltransferase [Trichococcus palustris]SFK97139.1 homocysteine S-methyltransferase [Trichococcus palustris]